MSIFLKYGAIFAAGALGYGGLELLWRGRTHWTMLLLGGACLLYLYRIATCSRAPLWKQCLLGGAGITVLELGTGCIVNLLLGWNVWDYTAMPLNLFGQVCLSFSLGWVALSAPVLWLCRRVDVRLKAHARRYNRDVPLIYCHRYPPR